MLGVYFLKGLILHIMKHHTSISKISINNFRNYESVAFSFPEDKNFIVISGGNGAGKTNILEAISLFSPGKGLRKASNNDLQNISNKSQPWGIAIDLNKDDNEHKLGTGTLSPDSTRRTIRINGEPVKSRSLVAEYISVIWLTPQMDKIFIETKSTRRRYFDKMMTDLNPELARDFFDYDRAMKDRTKILKDGIDDAVWLLNLEKIMIEKGIVIGKARINFCDQLNQQIQIDNISEFPKGHIDIDGTIENLLREHKNIEDTKHILFNEFLSNRPRDAARGGATTGAHKSDFAVQYIDKDMPASLCSTGEQKALLISTFLSFAHEMKDKHKQAPIILLDELIAHLDIGRKNSLFLELEKLTSQVFMTGTEKELFSEITDKSEVIDL